MKTITLASRLKGGDKPVVIQIGYAELYAEGHVPGSLHAGPAEEAEGLARVEKKVKGWPRDREVILYCGCCPYQECANLLPAFRLMRKLGFKKLRVLELRDDFNIDWKLKGYPVEK